jgi:zinc transport system substrate-binding protein
MKKTRWLFSILIYLSMQVGPVQADQKITVYTVNYPLAYFAQRIAGDLANVVFPAPAGVDPAFWQPGLETIRAYQQADLILLNGAGYAKWVNITSLPRLRSIDTSATIGNQLIKSPSGVSHNHGNGDPHSHSGTAFTTWLDFSLAIKQARVITEVLVQKLPQHNELLERNSRELEAELLEMESHLNSLFENQSSLPIFASHPVYQYLAKRYQLNLLSVTWEPGEVPGPNEWLHLKRLRSGHAANWMIWEAQPIAEIVDGLVEMGIHSLVYQPMGNRPASGDFLNVMRDNLKNLEKAFSQP